MQEKNKKPSGWLDFKAIRRNVPFLTVLEHYGLRDRFTKKGQKEAYILKAINYYKSGERKNDIMTGIAASISDADAANAAAYFSSLK